MTDGDFYDFDDLGEDGLHCCPAGSPDCGYVSDGDEQADWEHMYWEHQKCGECGIAPRDGDSVTHRSACPRLKADYVYPEVSRD